jgi:hypothetical protein
MERTKVDEMILNDHENYKEYLTLKSKTAKVKLDKLKPRISWKKKELIKIIEKYQNQIDELINVSKEYEKDIQIVASEYSYRRKINGLLKKHGYLSVAWDGDDDVYTTWVYSNDFEDSEDPNDPWGDEHYCDSYEEAYGRCLDYIKYHNKSVTKAWASVGFNYIDEKGDR